jgi:hypothetical protein
VYAWFVRENTCPAALVWLETLAHILELADRPITIGVMLAAGAFVFAGMGGGAGWAMRDAGRTQLSKSGKYILFIEMSLENKLLN